MPHIVKSTILNAPTDAVWDVLRDFNGHDRWHPAVATSQIERAHPSDKIGCIRRFKLKDGAELREPPRGKRRQILVADGASRSAEHGDVHGDSVAAHRGDLAPAGIVGMARLHAEHPRIAFRAFADVMRMR